MNINIVSIIRKGESETVEFKQAFDRDAIVSIGAMANRKGGIIVIGVSDRGEVSGVQIGKETLNQWSNQIAQSTEPRLNPSVTIKKINEKTIVVISVSEYSVKPVSVNGRCYRRIANSNRQLTPKEIADLHMFSTGVSWDALPATKASTQDLDIDKVRKYIDLAAESGRRRLRGKPLDVLKKLKLIIEGKPTWASILLFGKEPNGFLLQARIRCGRFKELTEIMDDNMIEGTLLEQADETIKAITKNIHVRYEIKGKIKRDEIWDYPIEALREAVLNSICHRDYTGNASTMIKIFDDHLYIWNPGELPGNLTVEDLLKNKHKSEPRNKLIAQYFYDIGEIEHFGSGIHRMIYECKKAGLPPPEFTEEQGGFQVIFRKNESKTTESELNPYSDASAFLSLNKRQKKIMKYLNLKMEINLSECKKLFSDVSEKTLYRDLQELVQLGLAQLAGEKRGRRYLLSKKD